jgi:hypothetical protein
LFVFLVLLYQRVSKNLDGEGGGIGYEGEQRVYADYK